MTTYEVVERAAVELPGEHEVGTVHRWSIPSGDETLEVYGQFLGVSSSRQSYHHHPSNRTALPDEKCRACRWFEPRIFREVDGQRRFLVHRTGQSTVPGEVILTSHEWVLGAHAVVETLTTRRRDPRTGDRTPYLTQPAARVLAQAASYDKALSRAYVDRAVV